MRLASLRRPAFLVLALAMAAAACGDTTGPLGLGTPEPDPDPAILTGPRTGLARMGTFDASGTEV